MYLRKSLIAVLTREPRVQRQLIRHPRALAPIQRLDASRNGLPRHSYTSRQASTHSRLLSSHIMRYYTSQGFLFLAYVLVESGASFKTALSPWTFSATVIGTSSFCSSSCAPASTAAGVVSEDPLDSSIP